MAHPARVAFFVAYPHVYGGVERSLELLANGLQERGWAVEILVPTSGIAADHFHAAGLSVAVVPAPESLLVYGRATRRMRAVMAAAVLPSYWWQLRRRVAEAAIVHTFSQRGFLLAGPAARLAHTPVVWHVGGSDPGRVLNAGVARMASAVIAVSRAATHGLPASVPVDVVPNGIDPRAFITASVGDPQEFGIVCAARFTPEKGVDVLVHAAALLHEDTPDLRVLILGGTQRGHETYQADLVRTARHLGVSEVVRFDGFVDEPFRRWQGAKVYVQPSRREGFGMAAAEAMASALPVVASSVGGLVDLLDHGRAGVLVPPDDPGALARAIKALLHDPGRAAQLAAAGRARVEANYTVDAMVDRVEAVYRRLLGRT